MDGEAQLAAAHISAVDTPLDHAQDEAMPPVELALTPMGHCWPKEEYAINDKDIKLQNPEDKWEIKYK